MLARQLSQYRAPLHVAGASGAKRLAALPAIAGGVHISMLCTFHRELLSALIDELEGKRFGNMIGHLGSAAAVAAIRVRNGFRFLVRFGRRLLSGRAVVRWTGSSPEA